MTTILTNHIKTNSFMGLITHKQKKNRRGIFGRRIFVHVESKDVLQNLAIGITLIIMGLTAGSISQQKMEFSQYSMPVIKAAT